MNFYYYNAINFLLIFLSYTSFSNPRTEPHLYQMQEGWFLDISDGAYVEGSQEYGGIQPDYKILYDDPDLQPLILEAQELKKSNISKIEKLKKIENLIDSNMQYTNYKNPYYLRLLKEHRSQRASVSLGRYVGCGAGVCREFALLSHILLKESGIPNYYVYAKIKRWTGKDFVLEDHAFVVFKFQLRKWVFDPYYYGFHGFRLKDLLSKNGVTSHSPQIFSSSYRVTENRRIYSINPYPKVWTPVDKNTKKRCLWRVLFGFNI